MASLSLNTQNQKKVSYRITYRLNKKQKTKSFKTKYEAEAYLPIITMIESKCKMNIAPPEEVELWVKQNYITMEEAVQAFPFFAQRLHDQKIAERAVDWKLIEERFSNEKLDRSGDRDYFGYNHQHNLSLFRRIKAWLQEEYPTLEMTEEDVMTRLRYMQDTGNKRQTRKHWLYAFKLIADIAVKLKMMHENPAKNITISVPPRPKHIQRVTVPQHICKAMLDWSPEIDSEGYIIGKRNHERKEPREAHRLSQVDLGGIYDQPIKMTRIQLMHALGLSEATVKRYTAQGLFPSPIREEDGKWYIQRDQLINIVQQAKNNELAKIDGVRLKLEQTTMRGCFPLAFRLGLWAGLRNNEVVWLPWDHVDISGRKLFIGKVTSPLGKVWSPKSDLDNEEIGTRERWLGMTPSLCKYFEKEIKRQEEVGIKTFFVFPAGVVNRPVEHGKTLTTKVLNDAFQKHLQWLGFPKQKGLTFYSLRHTFCTQLLRAGVNIEDVRDRMGHTDIRTTQTYLHAEDASAHVEDVLEQFVSDEDSQQNQ